MQKNRNKSNKTNKTKKSTKDTTQNKKLICNIVFAVFCFALVVLFIPTDIYYFTLINAVLILFCVLTGIFLLMKTKIGLICAYIINAILEIVGLLVAGVGIFEMATSGENSIFVQVEGMIWVLAAAAFAILWSGFYLFYYIRNRKHFTNKNLD